MIRRIKIEDIIIQKRFKTKRPGKEKIEECEKYYKEHGEVDKLVLVNRDNVLLDNYIRYLVLLENNIKEIEVEEIDVNHYHPNTTYVYGLHPVKNKEYVWRLPYKADFADKVIPGSKVLVSTNHGVQKIEVTRIETLDIPPINLPIKKVLRCISE